jgi:hypothetical protein
VIGAKADIRFIYKGKTSGKEYTMTLTAAELEENLKNGAATSDDKLSAALSATNLQMPIDTGEGISIPGANLTDRLRQRRGVMTINGFYSYVLGTDCNAENSDISEETWRGFDHNCLATAVNGEVFRDDLGVFSAYRKQLQNYYPDRIWREQIAFELHNYAASLQVNYSRCMGRKDTVAAEICKANGLQAAMQLFFLLKREYPPYYKWTYRALTEIDAESSFAKYIKELAETGCGLSAWEHIRYMPDNLNMSDRVVVLSELIAEKLRDMLVASGLTASDDAYLEKHVDEVLMRTV